MVTGQGDQASTAGVEFEVYAYVWACIQNEGNEKLLSWSVICVCMPTVVAA